jgi:hypothetical protein
MGIKTTTYGYTVLAATLILLMALLPGAPSSAAHCRVFICGVACNYTQGDIPDFCGATRLVGSPAPSGSGLSGGRAARRSAIRFQRNLPALAGNSHFRQRFGVELYPSRQPTGPDPRAAHGGLPRCAQGPASRPVMPLARSGGVPVAARRKAGSVSRPSSTQDQRGAFISASRRKCGQGPPVRVRRSAAIGIVCGLPALRVKTFQFQTSEFRRATQVGAVRRAAGGQGTPVMNWRPCRALRVNGQLARLSLCCVRAVAPPVTLWRMYGRADHRPASAFARIWQARRGGLRRALSPLSGFVSVYRHSAEKLIYNKNLRKSRITLERPGCEASRPLPAPSIEAREGRVLGNARSAGGDHDPPCIR